LHFFPSLLGCISIKQPFIFIMLLWNANHQVIHFTSRPLAFELHIDCWLQTLTQTPFPQSLEEILIQIHFGSVHVTMLSFSNISRIENAHFAVHWTKSSKMHYITEGEEIYST
jgi:hypothetical protein